ncbi:STAS domain-containing protein [Actinomycetospora sp. CA-101289]|uniref:STAS domain-containing protein n=1 Tax=Actinomycetospora sp. CA-101289 TaxID=3239893 RepID=UPI003D96AA2A
MTTDPEQRGTSFTGSPDGARVIRAGATLDAAAAAELRREVRSQLARSLDPLVVDLMAVRAAEPAAAAALRDLAYEAGDADVDLRLVRGPAAPEVTRALLDDESLFEIYPTLGAAQHRAVDVVAPPPDPPRPELAGDG